MHTNRSLGEEGGEWRTFSNESLRKGSDKGESLFVYRRVARCLIREARFMPHQQFATVLNIVGRFPNGYHPTFPNTISTEVLKRSVDGSPL